MLMDITASNRFNPVHFGLELLNKAQNLSRRQLKTSQPRVHGFATVNQAAPHEEVVVYVINKLESTATISLSLPSNILDQLGSDVTIVRQSVVDTPDHWGKLESSTSTSVSLTDTTPSVILPSVSFSRITVTRDM